MAITSIASAASSYAYVANYGDDTVSVIDTTTDTVIETITGFTGPWDIAAKPDGTTIYVGNSYRYFGEGEPYLAISTIDTTSNSVIDTTPFNYLGDDIERIAVSRDGNRVYVTMKVLNGYIIDPTSDVFDNTPVGIVQGMFDLDLNNPKGVAASVDGTKIYVASSGDGTITVTDLNGATITTIMVDYGADYIAVDPDGTALYVSTTSNVAVVNTNTNTLTTLIPVTSPRGIAVTPDGAKIYVASGSNNVFVFDTATYALITTIPLSDGAMGVAISPDGSKLYVTGGTSSNIVSVIDTATDTETSAITVGAGPVACCFAATVDMRPHLSIVPNSAIAEKDQSKTFSLVLDKVPDGLSGFDINLNIANPGIASITEVMLPDWAHVPRTTGVLPGTVRISGVDLDEGLEAGAAGTVLATFTVRGDNPGMTTITVTRASIDDDLGNEISPVVVDGTLTVYVPLQAAFYADPLSIKQTQTVSFFDQTTGTPGPATYLWSFGDGATSDGPNPSHAYQNPGKYTVTLTVTNQYGMDTETKERYIVVTGVVAFPGGTNRPADPDDDGLYEDINGNGRLDFNDVVLFYQNMDWIRSNEDVGIEPYDYNGNGALDFDDVVVLYDELLESH